jgi:integrase/recombinase XerC/integrase/recombinase XerD
MENTLTTTNTNPATMTTQAEIARVVSIFAEQQDVKPTSRNLYRRAVVQFFVWVLSSGRVIAALTIADVIAYKEHLLSADKSTLTVGGYINAIRRFYDWAEANKLYPNIAKGVRAPKRQQEFKKQPLSVGKVAELLRYEQGQSPRDYAIINLMARTGLRCVEVTRANIGDITYMGANNTRVLMVQGKGRDTKDNYVVLPDAAYFPIRDYLTTRKGQTEKAPLFVSESNHTTKDGRLTTRTVSAIAKNGLRNVGLDNKAFTAHSLRHAAGTNILRAGGTLEQAQTCLRHTDPATTQIYTCVALNERRLSDGGEILLDRLYNNALV